MDEQKKQKEKDEFDQFAGMMVELIESFKEVMKTGDAETKVLAIDMFAQLKEKMGETFYHLMEKHDIYPQDLEEFLADGKNEMNQRVREVTGRMEKINDEVTKEVEKVLDDVGYKKKKTAKNRKKSMVKRLRSKD